MSATTEQSQPRTGSRRSHKAHPERLHLPAVDGRSVIAVSEAGASLPRPSPLVVLNFAQRMAISTHERRTAQLAAWQIDQATHDRDLAAADELLRLAQEVVIFGDPVPLN